MGGVVLQDYGSAAASRPDADAQYAGAGGRFLGLLIDGIILSVIGWIIGYVIPNGQQSGLSSLVSIALSIAYQVYFFTSTGQTLGMKVMNTKLVDGNGQLLSMGSAVVRVIGSYVSAFILLIGYFMFFWDSKKQTLHDKMASSYVVKV